MSINVRIGSYEVQGIEAPDPDQVIRMAWALHADDAPITSLSYVQHVDGDLRFADERIQSVYDTMVQHAALEALRQLGID